jgi:hypothetical protein
MYKSSFPMAAALLSLAALAVPAMAGPITIVDIIPNSDSSETQQNSEPSIAVNPLNPSQVIAGAFTGIFSGPPTNVTTPLFKSH